LIRWRADRKMSAGLLGLTGSAVTDVCGLLTIAVSAAYPRTSREISGISTGGPTSIAWVAGVMGPLLSGPDEPEEADEGTVRDPVGALADLRDSTMTSA